MDNSQRTARGAPVQLDPQRRALADRLAGDDWMMARRPVAIRKFISSLSTEVVDELTAAATGFDAEHWDLARDLLVDAYMTQDGYPQKLGVTAAEMVRAFSVLTVACAYANLKGRASGSIVLRMRYADIQKRIASFAAVFGAGEDRGTAVRGLYLVRALKLQDIADDDVVFLHEHAASLCQYRHLVFNDRRFDRKEAERLMEVHSVLRDGAL